ncbi:MAG: CocE/NonD family hydrolase [Ilumatobacteraceae bacterium]|nr:CocE/NonD family hydrolase [Ilumatobacteraceae bacterium]
MGIQASDGVWLAATLYLPDGDGPFATLMEALPYRMDDITSSSADSYVRFVNEGGFAVLRLDLRGTGSSGGILDDEYTDIERADLRTVMEWIADQPWSTGRVGMFGTSYSGFNSLHMAMDEVPQLGAVVAMYATDDRYTDDVHYCGGVLRAIDLIDYPLYMVAMNALPPVPAVWGPDGDDDWAHEWVRRVEQTPPWMMTWLRSPTDSAEWRRGSIRTGPNGAGYERIGCPTMLISGWADGYRNNTFRTIERLRVPWRLLAGPWVHKDPSNARPGPNIDCDREIMAFFDQHLRGGPASANRRGQLFVRRPTAAQPDLALHDGSWRQIDVWPPYELRTIVRRVRVNEPTIDELNVEGDVGMYAWNSCAGGLPWGQPLDQRIDNARSLTYDWIHPTETMLLGNSTVTMKVRSSAEVGHVSVKLCDIAPDGTSTLITRGMLDLTHRGCWPADATGDVGRQPAPLVPDEWMDVSIEFEATTWTFIPGHRLRLAIAGTDWPNCWPPKSPFVLSVDRETVRLDLSVADELALSTHEFAPGVGPSDSEADGVEWRFEHDVIGRESRVHTRYGGPYEGTHGTTVVDSYEGSLGISTVDLSKGWARGRSRFELTFPLESGPTVCSSEATLDMTSDSESFHVTIHVRAERDGMLVAERTWTETLPR